MVKLKHTDEDVQTHHVLVVRGIVCLDVPNVVRIRYKHSSITSAVVHMRVHAVKMSVLSSHLRCGDFASEA